MIAKPNVAIGPVHFVVKDLSPEPLI